MKQLFFSIFLKLFIVTINLYAAQTGTKIPITTKEIEFTLEVLDGVKVDPLWLDFGNILKNSTVLYKAQTYLNIEGKFQENTYITTSFAEGTQEGNYTKLKIKAENNNSSAINNEIDVYIKNIENQIIRPGDTKIPIVGEIRSVGNVDLGKYNKTTRMSIIMTPVSPIK